MPNRHRAGRVWMRVLATAATVSAVSGCGDGGGTQPGSLRFGQLGHIEVHLETPIRLGAGEITQTLRWGSSGDWSLTEGISYLGVVGDETFRRTPGDPAQFAAAYASLITQVNEVPALTLFVDELDRTLRPECGVIQTRVTLTIHDDPRGESRSWTRCADGSLQSLTPVGAGPDAAAARVVVTADLVRDFTVGKDFVSAYHGSVPFATVERGQDTQAKVSEPFVVTDQPGWVAFWSAHTGRADPPPEVDFTRDMVWIGVLGERREAGDSVEIRRVLQVAQGTLTEIFERVPGDFCSPASRTHVPYHIVVAPRTPGPHRFSEVRLEEVPCGG